MKISNKTQVHDFLATVDMCKGNVYLRSTDGDCYNLKSELMKYVAIGALIMDKAGNLELFCDLKEDESLFMKFFIDNPEVL